MTALKSCNEHQYVPRIRRRNVATSCGVLMPGAHACVGCYPQHRQQHTASHVRSDTGNLPSSVSVPAKSPCVSCLRCRLINVAAHSAARGRGVGAASQQVMTQAVRRWYTCHSWSPMNPGVDGCVGGLLLTNATPNHAQAICLRSDGKAGSDPGRNRLHTPKDQPTPQTKQGVGWPHQHFAAAGWAGRSAASRAR